MDESILTHIDNLRSAISHLETYKERSLEVVKDMDTEHGSIERLTSIAVQRAVLTCCRNRFGTDLRNYLDSNARIFGGHTDDPSTSAEVSFIPSKPFEWAETASETD